MKMPAEHTAKWDGQERRTNERLRRIIADIQEQLLALQREVVAHGVKIAELQDRVFGDDASERPARE
jgi:hypothetical protein